MSEMAWVLTVLLVAGILGAVGMVLLVLWWERRRNERQQ